MKKSILLVIVCSVLVCCKNKTTQPVQNEQLFNDFFTLFSDDSTYQLSHIQFPITCEISDIEEDNETVKLTKDDWIFIEFSKDKEASKLETDRYEPVFQELSQDSIKYIRRGIDNGIHIEYLFSKRNGEWTLIKIIDNSN